MKAGSLLHMHISVCFSNVRTISITLGETLNEKSNSFFFVFWQPEKEEAV